MIIVVMGVAGAGKTVVGKMLARQLGFLFLDADDFHSPEAIAKMRAGVALDSADRAPWLARLAEKIGEIDGRRESAVLACSALKETYRRELRAAVSRGEIIFVYLKISEAVARARLEARRGHYMPESLVKSQFKVLEEPGDGIAVDGEGAVREVVREIRERLETKNKAGWNR